MTELKPGTVLCRRSARDTAAAPDARANLDDPPPPEFRMGRFGDMQLIPNTISRATVSGGVGPNTPPHLGFDPSERTSAQNPTVSTVVRSEPSSTGWDVSEEQEDSTSGPNDGNFVPVTTPFDEASQTTSAPEGDPAHPAGDCRILPATILRHHKPPMPQRRR